MSRPLRLRRLGRAAYRPVWEAMQSFTDARDADTVDELWLVEHPPVFTLGLNARPEHLLAPGDIEVVPVDRGGQVTYHGPGQAVAYLLFDLRRAQVGVRMLVEVMEQAVIHLLADHGVAGHGRRDAPGVYVPQAHGESAKLASVGLRVRRGCSYHGLAVNVDADLEPFTRINPCGYAGMPVTRLLDLGIGLTTEAAGLAVARHLASGLGAELLEEDQTQREDAKTQRAQRDQGKTLAQG